MTETLLKIISLKHNMHLSLLHLNISRYDLVFFFRHINIDQNLFRVFIRFIRLLCLLFCLF